MQQVQQEMLRTQQEFINDFKKMITLLLANLKKKSKGPKPDASSSMSKEKKKEGESSTSQKTESEDNPNFELPKSLSEEEGGLKNKDNHFRRMSEIEKCLEASTNQSNLQEVEVVQPYSVE